MDAASATPASGEDSTDSTHGLRAHTSTATPSLHATIDERRHEGSLSLFSNFWSQNSSQVDFNREGGEGYSSSTGLMQLTASTLVPRYRHRATKSTSSRVSLSSQPVLVRAYAGTGERSRTPSIAPTLQERSSMRSDAPLPPVEAFSFDGILRAVEPNIQEAIDGIAEIYARSKLSLASEYDAHRPPLGEITSPRVRQSGLAIRTTGLERTLTTVAEASSSSERLAGESRAGSTYSGNGKMTAYGSLRSIISRGKSPETSPREQEGTASRMLPSAWTMTEEGRPSIRTHSSAPTQLTLAAVAEIPGTIITTSEPPQEAAPAPAPARPTHPSIWLPWRRSQSTSSSSKNTQSRPPNAETALKTLLSSKGPEPLDHG